MYSFGFCMMSTLGEAKGITQRPAYFKLEDGTQILVSPLVSSNKDPEVVRAEIHKYVNETLDLTLRDEK